MQFTYLNVVLPNGQSITGNSTAEHYTGDFTVVAADSGPTYTSSADTTFEPFAVTLDSAGTPGINALLAAASAGTSPLTVTLYTATAPGTGAPAVTTGQITLTGATIVEAQTAGGGSALAFDYSSITVTPYTENMDGSYTVGTPVTTTVPDTASFAAPTSVGLTTSPTGDTLLLSDDSGLSDLQVSTYQFAAGPNGQAGPLVIEIPKNSENAPGVSDLKSSGNVIPSLTLDVEKTNGGVVTDEVTFNNVVVSSYVTSNYHATVTLNYESATLYSAYENPDGAYTNYSTTTITGDIIPCYLRGTRIRTPEGEVPVENLKLGDRVVTASGETRPILWLGSRSVDCARHRDPMAVWPVRIRAGALAPGQPERDLWVSPGHSLFLDGNLFQAEKLINGVTIERVERQRVEYWHVELDRHDVLLAEGAPAESYLDTGNRTSFLSSGEFVGIDPDFNSKHWSDTCAPLVFEGPVLKGVRTTLLQRAFVLGYVLSDDAGPHVLADGERIEPLRLSAKRFAFLIPAGRSSIELRSRTFIPAQTHVASSDRRELGVCVGRLQIDGIEIPLANEAAYASGWHALEKRADDTELRWSKGSTPLPPGTRLVVLDIASRSHCWVPPASSVTALNGHRLKA
jgi:hypothetical protein